MDARGGESFSYTRQYIPGRAICMRMEVECRPFFPGSGNSGTTQSICKEYNEGTVGEMADETDGVRGRGSVRHRGGWYRYADTKAASSTTCTETPGTRDVLPAVHTTGIKHSGIITTVSCPDITTSSRPPREYGPMPLTAEVWRVG